MEGCMSFIGKHKRLVILLVLVLVAGTGGSFLKSKQEKQTGYTVSRQNLREVMSFSGMIDAGVKANLRFQSAGKLTWVGVKEGDRVKKFQGIASLDRAQLKKSMEKYLNSYNKERNAFEQDQADNKDYAVSGLSSVQKETIKRTLQNAQADLNNSVLDFEIQNMAYRDAYLYTPIAGLVTLVRVPQVGINILASQAEFEVVDPESVYFSALADQTEVIKIKEGDKAEVVFDAYPEKKFEGVVTFVAFSPKEGQSSTVYEIRLDLGVDNLGYQLRLGMTGDVDFLLSEKKDILAVPVKYIKTENGTKTVLRGVGGKKTKVEVKVGENIDGLVEIVEGLNEGDVIYDQTK